jgi:hypothetical protein
MTTVAPATKVQTESEGSCNYTKMASFGDWYIDNNRIVLFCETCKNCDRCKSIFRGFNVTTEVVDVPAMGCKGPSMRVCS